jgi:hypothetical protein
MLLNIPSLNDSLGTLVVTIWFFAGTQGKEGRAGTFSARKGGWFQEDRKGKIGNFLCVDVILLI